MCLVLSLEATLIANMYLANLVFIVNILGYILDILCEKYLLFEKYFKIANLFNCN